MLEIRQIENVEEAMDIAFVRNTGSSFLTGNTSPITVSEQALWYDQYVPAHGRGEIYAFVGYEEKAPTAYGLVAQRDEDFWVTGVITDTERGNGYGEQLFRHLSEFVLGNLSNRVMLDVLKTNERALNLYHRLGYVALFEAGDKLVMCLDKENYHVQD